ncbi:hypothetical protein ACFQX7_14245 [Luedemannella flava]
MVSSSGAASPLSRRNTCGVSWRQSRAWWIDPMTPTRSSRCSHPWQ